MMRVGSCSKKVFFYFLLVSGVCLIIWNFQQLNILTKIYSFDKIIAVTPDFSSHLSNNSAVAAACKLPKLNSFHPFMMKFMQDTLPLKCNAGPDYKYKPTFFSVDNNVLHIQGQQIKSATYQVITRTDGDDFSVVRGNSVPITLNTYQGITNTSLYLPHEHVHLEFQTDKGIQHEFVLQAVPKQDVNLRAFQLSKHPYNIVIYYFDSTSAANFHRKMPLSMGFMKKDNNTLLFKGQTVVGDGTTRQMSALLTGVAEKDNPEARRGMPGTDYVDKWPWIFKTAKQYGYATLYSEDSPSVGAFSMRLLGFKDPPADHYGRPFFQEAESSKYGSAGHCCGTIPTHQHSFNYIKSLYSAYPNRSKLAVAMTTLGHGTLNEVQYADKDTAEFLQWIRDHDENTIVFIGGDHGARFGSTRKAAQGQLEERLPFLAAILPPRFKEEHNDLYENMVANTKVLTSPFDLHVTMRHIFTYPDYPTDIGTGQSFFTRIDPAIRTCVESGTPEHFCPCMEWEKIDTDHESAKEAVNAVIKYMNSQFIVYKVSHKCHELTLDTIKKASKQMPNEKVQRFRQTIRAAKLIGVPTVARFADKGTDTLGKETVFQVQFTVAPSKGLFEATLRFKGNNATITENGLSRLNAYGNQAHCVTETLPHLNLFCYCKNQMNQF